MKNKRKLKNIRKKIKIKTKNLNFFLNEIEQVSENTINSKSNN